MSRLSQDMAARMTDERNSQGWSIVSRSGDKSRAESASNRYAIMVCLFASLGGLFFGYDQGVTGGCLIMDSFLEDFCVGYHGATYDECKNDASSLGPWNDFVAMYNVLYYAGCVVGAFAANFVADRFGRRVAIFMASFLFCSGTLWVILSPSGWNAFALAGRVIEGMGVGTSSFSLPIYGAENAPKELRGMLSGFMQMTVVTGLLAAGLVNYAVEDSSIGWRLSNGVALIPPVVIMSGIFCVPESPRYLFKRHGRERAREELVKLRQTDDVREELQAIGEQISLETSASSTYKEAFSPRVRKRTAIAMLLQVFQQATGINPMFTYGGVIFESVVGSGLLSLIVLQVVNFVSTIPAMLWVDRIGRRSLLLWGAAGMVTGHLVAATTFVLGCSGDVDDPECSTGAGYVMIAFSSFFIFNFAISWGPICWIYPAEIFPMGVRAKCVSLSTMSNWSMGMVMMLVVKLFPLLNISGVFYLFAALCSVAGVFVYFFCPETKGILLEDIEQLFNKGVRPSQPGGTGKTPMVPEKGTPELDF